MNKENETAVSRRKFLAKSSAAVLAAGILGQSNDSTVYGQNNQPPKVDTQKPIQLLPFQNATERQTETPMPMPPDERVGFAIVGLGRLSLEQLLPAFAQCKKAKPVALVSGSPDKARQVAAQYGIGEKNIYNYQTYDQLKNNQEVQVIYIVLPNGLHHEYTLRGAAAGKHILCEKPMANSVKECEEMIAACQKAGRKLGIGKAAAKALTEAGFLTYATAPNVSDLAELKKHGCETLQLDVTDENQAREAIRTAENHNGSVQVLVNNAGYGQYGPIEEIPIDDIRKNFETNVFGLLQMCQLVLPKMREAGAGRIVNVSSVAGEMSQPGSGIYHATKHAVEAIDEALRIEVSGFNIQVVGILPGPVATHFDDVAVAQIPDTGKDSPYYIFKQNLAKATHEMLKPGGTDVLEPEDVAAKIVEAATAENPSARYHVGVLSNVMGRIHDFTPDVIWDAAMKMMAPSMDMKD